MKALKKAINIMCFFVKQDEELNYLRKMDSGFAFPHCCRKSREIGLDTTERIILEIKSFKKIALLLNGYFDDSNAVLTIKKILHKEVEESLRPLHYLNDKAQKKGINYRYNPSKVLDGVLFDTVRFTHLDKKRVPLLRIKLWCVVLFALGKELLKLIYRLIISTKKMAFGKFARKYYLFGVENGASCNRPGRTTGFDFIIDKGQVKKDDMIVFMKRGNSLLDELNRGGYDYVFFKDLKCPLKWYIKKVKTLLVFVVKMFFGNISLSSVDLLIKSYAVKIIESSLKWELLMENYCIKNIFDNEEHSFSHIVKTLILSKYDCRNVRLPHSQIDNYGYPLSYIYYNYFISSGKYLPRTFSSSWSRGTKIVEVGVWRNDDLFIENSENAGIKLRDLISQVYGQRKIITIFSGSSGVPERDLELVETGVKVLEHYRDCILFIKIKGVHDKYFSQSPIKERIQPYIDQNRLFLLTRESGWFSTPQYIFKYSTLNLANCGSVIVESLLANAPIFVTSSSFVFDTPFTKMLKRHILFDDPEKLWEAIKDYLETGDKSIFRFEDYYEWFDQYRDGKATERMRDQLINNESCHE